MILALGAVELLATGLVVDQKLTGVLSKRGCKDLVDGLVAEMRAVCHVDGEITAALSVAVEAILDAIAELEGDPSLRGVAQDEFNLWTRSPDSLITRERLTVLGREVGQAFVGELNRVGTSYLLNDVDVKEFLREDIDANAHVEADR